MTVLKLLALPFKVAAVVFIILACLVEGRWNISLGTYWKDEFWK
jgi:hypothetical protein